jgi:hypothetical protein
MAVLPSAFRVEIKGTCLEMEAACVYSIWFGGSYDEAISPSPTAGTAESGICNTYIGTKSRVKV